MIKGTARLLILLCCVLSAAEESRAVSSHWADVPFVANTAFAAFPAAMPEFKNEKQLATWRAEQASKADTRTAEETHAFYTGKPYVGSSGGYAFQYRSYNPELARWTSEDPSGFPDGANQNVYAPTPTSELDYIGLWRIQVSYSGTNNLTPPMQWSTDHVIGAQAKIEILGSIDTSHPVSTVTIRGSGKAEYGYASSGNDTAETGNMEVTVSVTDDGKLVFTPGASTPTGQNGDLKVASNLNCVFNDPDKKSGYCNVSTLAAYKPLQFTGFGVTVAGSGLNVTWQGAAQPSQQTSSGSISFAVVE